jgi:hypothetical protein
MYRIRVYAVLNVLIDGTGLQSGRVRAPSVDASCCRKRKFTLPILAYVHEHCQDPFGGTVGINVSFK